VADRVGLVLCDRRRAQAWRTVLANAGIAAVVEATHGSESEDGDFKVMVARRDVPAANAIVTRVTRGELALPTGIRPVAVIALVVIVVFVVALLAV